MKRKEIAIIAVTGVVFMWSAVMVALGQVAFIAPLAPALGLTVQQILLAARSQSEPASGHRVAAVPDKEGEAP